ncbi:MAG: starch-binding protein [Candidatus Izemoplasmataceae bacterium]
MLSFMIMIALSLFILVGAEHQEIQAESTENVQLIYVEAPEGWENLHIWAWDDDGAAAYANLGWPGKAMIADEANPGWFYLYVPLEMTNVIVNANEGTIQTGAFAVSGEDIWVTITATEEEDGEGNMVTVYTGNPSLTQATSGDLPEYIATKYIYAYVPIDWDTAAIWAWNDASGEGVYTIWPGEEMQLLDDGWFRVEIPAWADKVIINNFGDPDVIQTVDIILGEGDQYILLTEENNDGKFEAELYDEKPVIIEDGYTLFISVPESWDAPRIWAWSHPDGTGLFTTWPGEEIDFNSESGYYEIMVPTWVNRVIVNNGVTGDGAEQTVDGEVLEAVDSYVTIGEADDEGKYEILISTEEPTSGDDDPNTGDDDPNTNPGDDDDEPIEDEEEPNNGWVFYVVGGLVVVGAVAFFVTRKPV